MPSTALHDGASRPQGRRWFSTIRPPKDQSPKDQSPKDQPSEARPLEARPSGAQPAAAELDPSSKPQTPDARAPSDSKSCKCSRPFKAARPRVPSSLTPTTPLLDQAAPLSTDAGA